MNVHTCFTLTRDM